MVNTQELNNCDYLLCFNEQRENVTKKTEKERRDTLSMLSTNFPTVLVDDSETESYIRGYN
ncbi:hypothetical protein GCM10007978_45370 [Shewanella hanedai]|uniref:Uncharacterized protein n=1 Tax=Shewanella hanedai TaxID=25 RepID=A0A553JH12_SHEHA|nr:hypothetical protein [Shewanella hanedai]TRY11757.1 hypothetical protein FN961_23170 [Shewanella hanedai]GGJ02758.1 hypothetical protein GCM10007978_45370 [Shewanella hanedai]